MEAIKEISADGPQEDDRLASDGAGGQARVSGCRGFYNRNTLRANTTWRMHANTRGSHVEYMYIGAESVSD